jgi:hypothetical protein
MAQVTVNVKELTENAGEPAVSILCPLDTKRPGNTRDPRLLAQLRNEAVARLDGVCPDGEVTAMSARIDDAIATLDLGHPSEGVAVLVAPGSSRVLPLEATVEPRVVVGRTFATHDLVAALLQPQRARVLVLAQGMTRCFDLTGDSVVERRSDGFPVEVEPPTEQDTPHRDFPMDEHERAEATKFVFRVVERALTELQRRAPRPLVLVGTDRDLAYFDEVSAWSRAVVGRVAGNHERATASEISRLVQPLLAEHAREEQRRACDEAREAVGTRAVAGIAGVWSAAREGRGRRLLLEDGFRFQGRDDDGTLNEAPAGESGAFDAVDDVIDAVLRHDGDVVPVPAGALGDLGHVALLLRF